MENSLHIIAKRVLDMSNIQKTKLVHVTGPQSLYWGWKGSLQNETEKINHNAKLGPVPAPPPAVDHDITGSLIAFKDGSWGQWIEGRSEKWTYVSYWTEMVPFEETKCVARKERAQKHFGRVHWTTAQSIGQTDLPPISCRKHLENLSQKVEQLEILANKKDVPSRSNKAAPSNESITDLILKNSNNSTMCTYLAKESNEIMLKKDQLRKNSTYCGSCRWGGGVTCDARMDYMMSKYRASPEEAFLHVMEQAQCKNLSTTYVK
jgi:hypothetical protein